jgi:hypothetical protein
VVAADGVPGVPVAVGGGGKVGVGGSGVSVAGMTGVTVGGTGVAVAAGGVGVGGSAVSGVGVQATISQKDTTHLSFNQTATFNFPLSTRLLPIPVLHRRDQILGKGGL